jgi:hypothetical protein
MPAVEADRDAATRALQFPCFARSSRCRTARGMASGRGVPQLGSNATLEGHFPVSVRNSESLVNGSHGLHPLIGVKDVGTRPFSRAWACAEATKLA